MAGFFTDFLNNTLLDFVFGASSYSPPETLYVGLSMGSANRSGSAVEPSSLSYRRVPVPNDDGRFTKAVGGAKANASAITFPTAADDWGTVRSVFVCDAPWGGNVLAMADLARPRRVDGRGGPVTVDRGALCFSQS